MRGRARFLKEALRCFEENDGIGLHNLAIDLGADCDYEEDTVFTEADNRILAELQAELTRTSAAFVAGQRTRAGHKDVTQTTEILSRHLKQLSPEAHKRIVAVLARWSRSEPRSEPRVSADDDRDSLECHYAAEMVNKLNGVVNRASRLDTLTLKKMPSAEVQRYFEEAHDCYLYGCNIACAVLCRAILEAALENATESRDRENTVAGMINMANNRDLLTDERSKWAREVDTAGNIAIHQAAKFERRYQPEIIEELLLKTRAVVEDLYSAAS